MSQPDPTRTYVESTIIMTTVRVVAPFVFTFGLFVMFHGAESAGGGFQGGVIVAAAILLIAFAFGIEPTREWLQGPIVKTAMAVGGATFAFIGLGALLGGGAFLEYEAYGFGSTGVKYGIELVELGIGAIVSGVLVSLFFTLASGDFQVADGGEAANGSAGDAGDDAVEATGGEHA